MTQPMDDELQKVDTIRERAGVGYREARQALSEAGGDIVEALARLEEQRGEQGAAPDRDDREARFAVSGRGLVDKVREIIRQGNVSHIRIRQGDRILLEFPVTVGVVGTVLLPYLAALGVVACMVTSCTIEVRRRPGDTEDDRQRRTNAAAEAESRGVTGEAANDRNPAAAGTPRPERAGTPPPA